LVGFLSHSRICSLRSFARARIATVDIIIRLVYSLIIITLQCLICHFRAQRRPTPLNKALTTAVRSVRLRIGRFEAGNGTSILRRLIPAVVNGLVEEVRVLWLPLTWGIVREIQHFGRHSGWPRQRSTVAQKTLHVKFVKPEEPRTWCNFRSTASCEVVSI